MNIKQSIITTLMTTSLLFGSTTVMAKTPSHDSLLTLTKVTNTEQIVQETMKSGFVNAFVHTSMNSMVNYLPEEKRSQVEALLYDLSEKIWQDVNLGILSEQIINTYINIAKEHYTQQEVNAMIEFYQTPVGQSIITKEALVTKALTKSAMSLADNNKFIQAIDKSVAKHLPVFEKQVQELLK